MKVRITNHALDRYRDRIGPLPESKPQAWAKLYSMVEAGVPPPPAVLRKCECAAKHVALGRIVVYHEETRAVFVVVEQPDAFAVVTVLRPYSKHITSRAFRSKEMQRMRRESRVKGYA